MSMNIGTVIKMLRQERGMVQEQVAEYLNVSTQAVSRWETGSALPDITQVPALANLFGCSSDMLLGVDIAAAREKIDAICRDAGTYLFEKRHDEAEEMLRAALKEYPNSYDIMVNLALVLFKANRIPEIHLSRESLIADTLKGTEKYRYKQKQLALKMMWTLQDIVYLQYNSLDDGTGPYRLDECITLHTKVIDIIDILVEKGNYGDYHRLLSDTHLNLTFFHIRKKDAATAMNHFRLAAKHAILQDATPQTNDDLL